MNHIPLAPTPPPLKRLSLALAILAAPVCTLAQSTSLQHYTVVDLGPVGPSTSPAQPFTIARNGLISGEIVIPSPSNASAFISQAALLKGSTFDDIGSPGLGGPNSVAFGANFWGQAVGQADTQTPDPNGEDFCGSAALGLVHSGNTCVPFVWQDGTMFALPRLRNSSGTEGNNGSAAQVNDYSVAAGTSENGDPDSTCPGGSVSPQSIQFKPVIWFKPLPWSDIQVQELATIEGDPDGVALALNDHAQVVGATGNCAPFNAIEQNNLTPLHAVLWENGKATDLGNLGGDGKFNGIFADGLNDKGQVVGSSDTAGDASFHAFLWQKGHITDLGTLAGDSYSQAITISNNGLVLGVSLDASFNPRAALWHDGTATDLNTLVPKDATLHLESACSINGKGEIIGFASSKSNPAESHAYLAKPVSD